MRLTIVFKIIMIWLCFPFFLKAQTKRALVIGLGIQEDSSWQKINGDKDVPYIIEILKEAKYSHILTCINECATKKEIVSNFEKLEKACCPNDIVYVHFSGHGQQMKDLGNDEEDELDECWIPYDAYRMPCEKDRGEKHLIDDEINLLLGKIRHKIGEQGKMLVVIDACHSGDATRGTEGVVRGSFDIFETIKSLFYTSEGTDDSKNTLPMINRKREQWITLSACESHQLNIEMKEPCVGKLTYALYTKIKNKDTGNNEKWFQDLKKIVNVNTKGRPQRPVMTGEVTRYKIIEIFQ